MTAQLTTTQAIRKVLEQADGPLKAGEIADRVLPLVPGLKGKTPKATIAAKLYTMANKPDTGVVKGEGGFTFVAPPDSGADGAEDEGPVVIAGTKVVRVGREAKADPKPSGGKRRAKAA